MLSAEPEEEVMVVVLVEWGEGEKVKGMFKGACNGDNEGTGRPSTPASPYFWAPRCRITQAVHFSYSSK